MKIIEKLSLNLKTNLIKNSKLTGFTKSPFFNFHSTNNNFRNSSFLNCSNYINNKNNSSNSYNNLYNAQTFDFSRAIPEFRVRNSSDTNKSQRGIYHFKRPSTGMKKCFSMKHSLRKFQVNQTKLKIKSDLLNTNFHIYISMKALRVIKRYGGLDNYVLKSKNSVIEDSQFLMKLKKMMTDKTLINASDEYKRQQLDALQVKYRKVFNCRRLQTKRKSKFIPSIFYPSETLKTDYSNEIYPPEKFISRLEQAEIDNLLTEIEICTDNNKKILLQEKLKSLTHDPKEKTIKEVLYLQPIRHSDIRNEFMRIENRFTSKMKYIDLLKISENMIKKVLEEKYKHYSEDYPEVQLILQKTEHQAKLRTQKKMSQLRLRGYSEKLGDTSYLFGEKENAFDPYGGKQGRVTRFFSSNIRGNFLEKRLDRKAYAKKLRMQVKRTRKRESLIRENNAMKKLLNEKKAI